MLLFLNEDEDEDEKKNYKIYTLYNIYFNNDYNRHIVG